MLDWISVVAVYISVVAVYISVVAVYITKSTKLSGSCCNTNRVKFALNARSIHYDHRPIVKSAGAFRICSMCFNSCFSFP